MLDAVLGQNRSTGLAVAAPVSRDFRQSFDGRAGYVDRGQIGRENIFDIISIGVNGPEGDEEDRINDAVNDNFSVAIQVDTAEAAPGGILFAVNIQP